jgi:hypothetical protein
VDCWAELPLPLHPNVGPPPTAGALTSLENPAANPVSPLSRRREAPVSYRLHPHAQRVASPPWVLKRLPLLHLCHGSTAPGRAARLESGDRSGVRSRAAPPSCGPCRPRPTRQTVGRVQCAHGPSRRCGRGPRATVQLGQARIRPSGIWLYFYIFWIYSIPCKFKNLCRIH